MGVELRRRFGFPHGELTAFEDEDLTARRPARAYSAILEAEIERPRVGPMRDIVATIQPEQDVIVRADLSRSRSACRARRAPGKTAVGLHRAAYLLYAHREQLTPPGRAGGRAERQLPALHPRRAAGARRDRGDADHDRRAGRARRCRAQRAVAIRGDDPPPSATLKGDARMAEVLRAGALVARRRCRPRALVVPRGARRWRVAAYEVEEMVDRRCATRGVRYGAARAMLPQRLAHRILLRMEAAGDSPDDRVQDAVARSKPVKDVRRRAVAGGRPGPAGVAAARPTPSFLAAAADGHPRPRRSRRCCCGRSPPARPAPRAWSLADAILVDEAADLVERTPGARPRRGGRGAGPVADDAARGRRAAPRPARSPCSATSPRPPRPGPPAPGRRRSATSASRDAHVEELTARLPGAGRGDRVRRPAAAR